MNREEERWHNIEHNAEKEEQKWHQIRSEGNKSMKNASNVAYNVVTLQYDQNTRGEEQKYSDDMGQYLALTLLLLYCFKLACFPISCFISFSALSSSIANEGTRGKG